MQLSTAFSFFPFPYLSVWSRTQCVICLGQLHKRSKHHWAQPGRQIGKRFVRYEVYGEHFQHLHIYEQWNHTGSHIGEADAHTHTRMRVYMCAHRHTYCFLKAINLRGTFGTVLTLLNDMSEEMGETKVELGQTHVWQENCHWEFSMHPKHMSTCVVLEVTIHTHRCASFIHPLTSTLTDIQWREAKRISNIKNMNSKDQIVSNSHIVIAARFPKPQIFECHTPKAWYKRVKKIALVWFASGNFKSTVSNLQISLRVRVN